MRIIISELEPSPELRINLDITYPVNYNACVACRWWQWEMASEECSSAPALSSAISFSFAKRSSASNAKKECLGRGGRRQGPRVFSGGGPHQKVPVLLLTSIWVYLKFTTEGHS